MPMNDTDWSIDRSTGDIRYIGGDHDNSPSYATVIEFHRWLQDKADNASTTGNDELDITDTNPSERSTDNIITLINSYNIDSRAAEHLYDGSIIQSGGAEIYDGIVNFGNIGVTIQLIQNGAMIQDDYWNQGPSGAHTGSANASVLTDSSANWTADEHIGKVIYNVTDGSSATITDNTTNTITATLSGGTEDDWDTSDVYIIGSGLNEDPAQGISHRFMVRVRTGAADVDGRRLLGLTREFGNTFAEFSINGTSRGNNVLALTDGGDLNNATAIGTVEGWTTAINDIEGYNTIDVQNDGAAEPFYSSWDRGSQTINELYERAKWYVKEPVITINNADDGTDGDVIVDNATITGQAQGFSTGSNAEIVTKVAVKLKIGSEVGGLTGNITAAIYSDTAGAPNTQQAISDNVAVSQLISSTDYEWTTFTFSGANLVELTASTTYHLVIEHTAGDADDYIHIQEDTAAAGVGSFERYENSGGWSNAAGTNSLYCRIYTAPDMYGLPGSIFRGVTHQVQIVDTAITGTFNAVEPVSWTGGTGQLLAASRVTSTGTTDYFWIQLLTGTAPGNSVQINGDTSGASVNTAASGATTDRSSTITPVFIGASTGSAVIGGYGAGVEYVDLTQNDTLFALDAPNTALNPPNNVTYTVSGLDTDSRVLVAPRASGVANDSNGDPAVFYGQMAVATTALTGAAETSVEVNSIPASGFPDSGSSPAGTIRIQQDNGNYKRVEYDSISGTTITFTGNEDFSGATNGASVSNNVFFSYIDEQAAGATVSYQQVHDGSNDQFLTIVVRDGASASPTKQYIAGDTWNATSKTNGAILTTDE